MKININTNPTIHHTPDIERQIYVIKEIERAFCHTLPFKHVSKVILIDMFMNCELWIDSFLKKGGVYESVSSCTIFTGVNFDYNKYCNLRFFQYAQVHQEKHQPTAKQPGRTEMFFQ